MEGRGRNNNINLLRLLAALAVVASHSFAIATGDVSSQPLKNSLGLSLGEIAVDVFSWWPVIPLLATAILDHLFMLAYLVCLPLLVVWIAYAGVLGGNRVARGPD